jgi:hypothetical protein
MMFRRTRTRLVYSRIPRCLSFVINNTKQKIGPREIYEMMRMRNLIVYTYVISLGNRSCNNEKVGMPI